MADRAEHPFLELRFLGAISVAALGGGVALTLLLAKILLDAGLLVGLLSVSAILLIYKKQYLSIYAAANSTTAHDGCSFLEVITATCVAFILTFIVVYIYVYQASSEEKISSVRIDKIEPEVISGADNINVFFKNYGNYQAQNIRVGVFGYLASNNPTYREKIDGFIKAQVSSTATFPNLLFPQQSLSVVANLFGLNSALRAAYMARTANLHVFYDIEYDNKKFLDCRYWRLGYDAPRSCDF